MTQKQFQIFRQQATNEEYDKWFNKNCDSEFGEADSWYPCVCLKSYSCNNLVIATKHGTMIRVKPENFRLVNS